VLADGGDLEAGTRQPNEKGVPIGPLFILGVLFALTFCRISAALFFGSLLPLAIATDAELPVFLVYGLATTLPVSALALLVVVGAYHTFSGPTGLI